MQQLTFEALPQLYCRGDKTFLKEYSNNKKRIEERSSF